MVVCESVKWVEKVTPSRLLLVVGLWCPSPWRWCEGKRTYYPFDSIKITWSVCKHGLLGCAHLVFLGGLSSVWASV